MVGIAIVGLLIALVFPAVQAAWEAARATTCQSNQKQIGIAQAAFVETYGCYPRGIAPEDPNLPDQIAFLPYLDAQFG